MSPTPRGAFELDDGVQLCREIGGLPAEPKGAISGAPREDAYGVELFAGPGRTIGLVDATAERPRSLP